MNERIQQLAEQALEYAEKNQSADIPRHWFRLYNEKFAELIIADAIKIVEPDSYHQAYPDNVIGSYGGLELLYDKVAKIKRHFGV